MSSTGRRLRESNEEILKYINQLRDQRNELGFLVDKQKSEKSELECERARISYKLNLINKSLNQKFHALALYDTTLNEIETKYKGLADSTQGLLTKVRRESSSLENSIDKRIGTENECQNCPQCDILPPPSITTKVQNLDVPTKQPYDGDRRTGKVDNSVFRGTIQLEENIRATSHPLYTRTMEYPMVLSPMMKEDNLEQLNIKMSNAPSYHRVEEETASTIETSSVNQSQASKDTKSGDSSIASGNFLDGDLPDVMPSKEKPQGQTEPDHMEKLEPPPEQAESANPQKITETTATTSENSDTLMPHETSSVQQQENPLLNEYDEVLEEGNSRSLTERTKNPEECRRKSKKNNRSSVDVFKQGYRTQHEQNEDPPTLARYKKSMFNRKDNSLFIEK